jgi:hypothetical protein
MVSTRRVGPGGRERAASAAGAEPGMSGWDSRPRPRRRARVGSTKRCVAPPSRRRLPRGGRLCCRCCSSPSARFEMPVADAFLFRVAFLRLAMSSPQQVLQQALQQATCRSETRTPSARLGDGFTR